jgi:hypothetical protein
MTLENGAPVRRSFKPISDAFVIIIYYYYYQVLAAFRNAHFFQAIYIQISNVTVIKPGTIHEREGR